MTRSCSSCSRTGRTRIGLTSPPAPDSTRIRASMKTGNCSHGLPKCVDAGTSPNPGPRLTYISFPAENDTVIPQRSLARRSRDPHDPDRGRRPVGRGYVRADAEAGRVSGSRPPSRPRPDWRWPTALAARRDHPRHADADHQRPAVPATGPDEARTSSTFRSRSSPATTSSPIPSSTSCESLGASIRFKPLWLEDLIALAKTLDQRA